MQIAHFGKDKCVLKLCFWKICFSEFGLYVFNIYFECLSNLDMLFWKCEMWHLRRNRMLEMLTDGLGGQWQGCMGMMVEGLCEDFRCVGNVQTSSSNIA